MILKFIVSLLFTGAISMVSIGWASAQSPSGNTTKPRIIITTDPELDDLNSLLRFLLYSNDFQVEGLVYASSGFHWKGDGKGTLFSRPHREYNRFGLHLCPCTSWRWNPNERFIHEAVEAYTIVYPNLKKHHPDYPEPAFLQSKIKEGNVQFDGDISQDTEGSNLIKKAILENQPGPLFLAAWGGMSTIARALKSIAQEFQNSPEWPHLQKRISGNVILLPSGDQDDVYTNYIGPNWPNIKYRQFTRNADFGYTAPLAATELTRSYLDASWMKTYIRNSGPLGKLYRVWGDGKQMVPGDIMDYFGIQGLSEAELKAKGYIVWLPPQAPGTWISEGDTPTYLNLIDNGFLAWQYPETGGWGGMQNGTIVKFLENSDTSTQAFTNAINASHPSKTPPTGTLDFSTLFPEIQNDFAARMKWTTTAIYSNANHSPKLQSLTKTNHFLKPGASVVLKAKGSDPDGNTLKYNWFELPTASNADSLMLSPQMGNSWIKVTVSQNAEKGQNFHVVLRAEDNGTPAMIRYLHYVLVVQ